MRNSIPEHADYKRYTTRQRVDTAIHSLTGLLHGIAIDEELNAQEIAEVLNWCKQYRELKNREPFKELITKLDEIMVDGLISPDEQEDLLWVCKNLSPEGIFYDEVTHEIQKLHGILHGILADGNISLDEAKKLQEWIYDNDHLKGSYPYDELESLLLAVLEDGKIDEEEQGMLRDFFEEFIEYSFSKRVRKESERVRSGLKKIKSLPSICASCPVIVFDDKSFVFTGTSKRAKRSDIAEHVDRLGGSLKGGVSGQTDFLVVGSGNNPCWAFSCYGRKVEKAVEMRKEGREIVIVHESDFWDAVEDAG
jgi:NAD-dependent DNA ligase